MVLKVQDFSLLCRVRVVLIFDAATDMGALIAPKGARKSTEPPTHSYSPGLVDYQMIGPLVEIRAKLLQKRESHMLCSVVA